MANSPAAPQTLGWRVQPVGLTAKPIRPHQSQGVEPSPLFADIPPSDQDKIVSAAISRKFVRRQTIFAAGDPVKEILLLPEGCVKITQLGENASEIILRLHDPAQLLGPSPTTRHGRLGH